MINIFSEKNQENCYRLNGLERFGGIYSKLNDFYQGDCDKNDLKDELELMIIVANRMLKIPKILMNHIKKLNLIIGPYHWSKKIDGFQISYAGQFPEHLVSGSS